jgi:hypothetical protein
MDSPRRGLQRLRMGHDVPKPPWSGACQCEARGTSDGLLRPGHVVLDAESGNGSVRCRAQQRTFPDHPGEPAKSESAVCTVAPDFWASVPIYTNRGPREPEAPAEFGRAQLLYAAGGHAPKTGVPPHF